MWDGAYVEVSFVLQVLLLFRKRFKNNQATSNESKIQSAHYGLAHKAPKSAPITICERSRDLTRRDFLCSSSFVNFPKDSRTTKGEARSKKSKVHKWPLLKSKQEMFTNIKDVCIIAPQNVTSCRMTPVLMKRIAAQLNQQACPEIRRKPDKSNLLRFLFLSNSYFTTQDYHSQNTDVRQQLGERNKLKISTMRRRNEG